MQIVKEVKISPELLRDPTFDIAKLCNDPMLPYYSINKLSDDVKSSQLTVIFGSAPPRYIVWYLKKPIIPEMTAYALKIKVAKESNKHLSLFVDSVEVTKDWCNNSEQIVSLKISCAMTTKAQGTEPGDIVLEAEK